MTDLYEAIRAAMTPDGRVRMTLELLTAMHEEGERRSRVDDAAQSDPLTEMRDRFLTTIGRMREAESRAETAERELEGAEREADEQRERRKRAEVERDAAHARAQEAERELAEIHRDGGELAELSAHARACLDPEIVSRDPAHARLAALVERIEGGRAYEQADDWQRRAEKAERGRDELAAQLAALREAAARYVHSLGEDEETHPTLGRVFVSRDDDGAEDALDEALADTAPAVEAYTRRVQAEALESAADSVCDHEQLAEGRTLAAGRTSLQRWLRARAAEIRGGR